MVLTASFLFVSSAQNGLTAVLGQQHAMTGQISAAWNVFLSIPTFAALLAGGALSGLLEDKGSDQAVRILFLVGAAIMFTVAAYALWRPGDVFDNVRVEARRRPASDGGPQAAGAALADLSGDADLAAVEFRARLGDAAAVSSSERAACLGRAMGPVECDLRRFLHSDLHRLWHSVPEIRVEDAAAVGNGDRGSADGAADVHPFGDGRPDRRGADRPDGRHCHRRLSRPDHAVVPARACRAPR